MKAEFSSVGRIIGIIVHLQPWFLTSYARTYGSPANVALTPGYQSDGASKGQRHDRLDSRQFACRRQCSCCANSKCSEESSVLCLLADKSDVLATLEGSCRSTNDLQLKLPVL